MAARVLNGIPVSTGISVGRVFFMNRDRRHLIPRRSVAPELVDAEKQRLKQAFAHVRGELEGARDKLPPELRDHAALIDTHLQIAADPKLMGAAMVKVHSLSITAEWGLEQAVGDLEKAFAAIDNPYIRDRIQDVSVVADRVMDRLLGLDQGPRVIEGRVVLMAHDLTPADTAELDPAKIMSFVTAKGGKTSHTGILARSMQIPALVGVENLEETVADGQLVIIDGLQGKLLVNPDETELAYYSDLKYQFEAYHASTMRQCHYPGETIDGYSVTVLGNIELFEEVTQVLDNGGDGVGLYRTEFAFMNRREFPGERELYEEYRQLAEMLGDKRCVFRTLDIGADKLSPLLDQRGEDNPALGLRAIRFCLKNEGLFRRQLRAIIRASAHGNTALMFPMISGLYEVQQAKHLVRQIQYELESEDIPFDRDMPVGIMIELPAAVMIAEHLAREVDFFSIGTNDLIQYSLGIDRTNAQVSYLYQPLHPAVVRSIKHVVDAAHAEGVDVSVCGELASDPYCVPILMGMQVDAISITPQAIPGIKRIIRQTTMEECASLLKEVLASRTVAKINRTVKETIFERFPEELMFYSSLLDQDDI